MIIKKDSWHYRLLDLFEIAPWELRHYGSFGLCPYCRRVFVALLLAFISCLLLLVPICLVAMYVEFCLGRLTQDGSVPMAFIGGATITIIAALLINRRWGDYFKEKEKRLLKRYRTKTSFESKPKKPKEPSLIREWFKAIHDKVCPSITLEE